MGDCEMYTGTGEDGIPCAKPAIGTTEDGVRVCRECAAGMVREGFRVDYDDASTGQPGKGGA